MGTVVSKKFSETGVAQFVENEATTNKRQLWKWLPVIKLNPFFMRLLCIAVVLLLPIIILLGAYWLS